MGSHHARVSLLALTAVGFVMRLLAGLGSGAISRDGIAYLDVAASFLRRFLLHVLPKGFVRLRHYGFLSNRARRTKVQLCRKLLGAGSSSQQVPDEPATDSEQQDVRCPACKRGNMVVVMALSPDETPPTQWPSPQLLKAG